MQSVIVVVKEFLNELRLLVSRFVREKLVEFFHRRDTTDHVQIQPSTPFAVTCVFGRLQLVLAPSLNDQLIDAFYLGACRLQIVVSRGNGGRKNQQEQADQQIDENPTGRLDY